MEDLTILVIVLVLLLLLAAFYFYFKSCYRVDTVDESLQPEFVVDRKRTFADFKRSIRNASYSSITMPSQFKYTTVIVHDLPEHGLLHSFLRHGAQWEQNIGQLPKLVRQLPANIRQQIHTITGIDGDKAEEKTTQYKQFNQLLKTTPNGSNATLKKIQNIILEFIDRNVTADQYEGQHLTPDKKRRIFFRVSGKNQQPSILTLGVSNDLFLSDEPDRRPFRLVVTVFFTTMRDMKYKLQKAAQQLV